MEAIRTPREAQRSDGRAGYSSSRNGPVLSSELFETYAGRLARRAVAAQFVAADHQVLLDEERLVAESESMLRSHIESSVPLWNISRSLAKTIIVSHVRRLILERLEMKDLDEETMDAAAASIQGDGLDRMFPESWHEA